MPAPALTVLLFDRHPRGYQSLDRFECSRGVRSPLVELSKTPALVEAVGRVKWGASSSRFLGPESYCSLPLPVACTTCRSPQLFFFFFRYRRPRILQPLLRFPSFDAWWDLQASGVTRRSQTDSSSMPWGKRGSHAPRGSLSKSLESLKPWFITADRGFQPTRFRPVTHTPFKRSLCGEM